MLIVHGTGTIIFKILPGYRSSFLEGLFGKGKLDFKHSG